MPTITIPGDAIPWLNTGMFNSFTASGFTSPASIALSPGDVLALTYASGLVTVSAGAPHGTPGSYDPTGVGYNTGGGIFNRPSDSIPGEFNVGSDIEMCGAFTDSAGNPVAAPIDLKACATGTLTLPAAPLGTTQFTIGVNRYEDWSHNSGSWVVDYTINGGSGPPPPPPIPAGGDGGFDEIQLPANYSWGAKVGHAFSTDLLIMESSFDDRHPNWLQEIGIYDISHTIRTREQAQELLSFFYCRFGRAYGFRFKDWNDYQAIMQPLGGGPDFAGSTGLATNVAISSMWRFRNVVQLTTASAHHLSPGQKFSITGTSDSNGRFKVLTVQSATVVTFKFAGPDLAAPGITSGFVTGNPYQMGKFYTDGAAPYFRYIVKPCTGLLTDATGYTPPVPIIYDNGVALDPLTDYDIDFTSGLVAFPSLGPANGDLLQWTGDFDVPVRFDADLALLSMNSENEANWDNLQLIGLTTS